jgi:hypothetical protein
MLKPGQKLLNFFVIYNSLQQSLKKLHFETLSHFETHKQSTATFEVNRMFCRVIIKSHKVS